MLESTSFLQVALFKLGTPFAFKVQAGVSERCIYFLADLCTINFLALAHYHALFGPHLHPAFRVSLKDLSVLRRHCEPTLARIIENRRSVRWRHCVDTGALLTVRLSIGQRRAQNQNRKRCATAYKV